MFQSARFKLTLFYLGAILALSLTFSFTTRWLAQREFVRSNIAQRGEFRGVARQIYGYAWPVSNDQLFNFQEQEQDQVRDRLNRYVILINLGALIIGGVSSYWFAGRTLRPIEEAHDAQKRFAADASHELRTPLTVMKAENEVFLRQKDFSKDDARALISSNLEEVDRLERLASSLLALTHYEQAHLELTGVVLKDVVESAVAQTQRSYPTATFDLRVGRQRVTGHADSLVQLINIVLDNACKYAPADTPVKLETAKAGDQVQLIISDQGQGIAPDDLPHIFERLYRGDKARSSHIPGHGLGLALARQIANANNGTITAANQSAGGAQFTISLPKA